MLRYGIHMRGEGQNAEHDEQVNGEDCTSRDLAAGAKETTHLS